METLAPEASDDVGTSDQREPKRSASRSVSCARPAWKI